MMVNEKKLLKLYEQQDHNLLLILEVYPYFKLKNKELKLILALNQFNNYPTIQDGVIYEIDQEQYHVLDKAIHFFMKTVENKNRHILLINLIIGTFLLFQNINLAESFLKYCNKYFGKKIYDDIFELDKVQGHLNEIINNKTLSGSEDSYTQSILDFAKNMKLKNIDLITSKSQKDKNQSKPLKL